MCHISYLMFTLLCNFSLFPKEMMHHSNETIMLFVAPSMSYSSSNIEKTTPECCSTITASDGGENISKIFQQTGSLCCQRRVWYPSLFLSASLSKCCSAAAAGGERRNKTLFLGVNQPFSPASTSCMKSVLRTLGALQLLGGNSSGPGSWHLSIPIPPTSEMQSETKRLVSL